MWQTQSQKGRGRGSPCSQPPCLPPRLALSLDDTLLPTPRTLTEQGTPAPEGGVQAGTVGSAPFSPTSAPTSVQRSGQQWLIAAEEMQGEGGLEAHLPEAAPAPELTLQLAPESQVGTWMGGSARKQARQISFVRMHT